MGRSHKPFRVVIGMECGHVIVRRLIAALLGVVLVSCSTTHASLPGEGQELSRFVLVMREHPDGQVSYTWHRAEEFDLERYPVPSLPAGRDGRIVHAAARPRDCMRSTLNALKSV
jgi:hypothetical protein